MIAFSRASYNVPDAPSFFLPTCLNYQTLYVLENLTILLYIQFRHISDKGVKYLYRHQE